jgi:hypothetical protein
VSIGDLAKQTGLSESDVFAYVYKFGFARSHVSGSWAISKADAGKLVAAVKPTPKPAAKLSPAVQALKAAVKPKPTVDSVGKSLAKVETKLTAAIQKLDANIAASEPEKTGIDRYVKNVKFASANPHTVQAEDPGIGSGLSPAMRSAVSKTIFRKG